jgi:hypothetical protein
MCFRMELTDQPPAQDGAGHPSRRPPLFYLPLADFTGGVVLETTNNASIGTLT